MNSYVNIDGTLLIGAIALCHVKHVVNSTLKVMCVFHVETPRQLHIIK